jgi:hypothetical protein
MNVISHMIICPYSVSVESVISLTLLDLLNNNNNNIIKGALWVISL